MRVELNAVQVRSLIAAAVEVIRRTGKEFCPALAESLRVLEAAELMQSTPEDLEAIEKYADEMEARLLEGLEKDFPGEGKQMMAKLKARKEIEAMLRGMN